MMRRKPSPITELIQGKSLAELNKLLKANENFKGFIKHRCQKTPELRQAVIAKSDFTCQECGTELTRDTIQVSVKVPLDECTLHGDEIKPNEFVDFMDRLRTPDGIRFVAPENYLMLCGRCRMAKTSRENRKRNTGRATRIKGTKTRNVAKPKRQYSKNWRNQRTAELIARDGNQCQECHAEFTDDNPSEIDHIVPRSDPSNRVVAGELVLAGGIPVDAPSNTRLLCGTCHSRKSRAESSAYHRKRVNPNSNEGTAGDNDVWNYDLMDGINSGHSGSATTRELVEMIRDLEKKDAQDMTVITIAILRGAHDQGVEVTWYPGGKSFSIEYSGGWWSKDNLGSEAVIRDLKRRLHRLKEPRK